MTQRQTIRFCSAHDGVRLAYATSGKGPPLVKVGNWLTHLEFDFLSPVWGYLLEMLSRDRTVVRYDQFFTSQFIPGGTLEQHRWFNELERLCTSPSNAARMIRAFNEVDVTALLPELRCPTLVLHATGDLRVPFAEGRLIATLVEQARFVPLDTANHPMVSQDPQWPRWEAEVRDFLGTPEPFADARFGALTPRERELLELIARGRDNAQIGAVMQLTDKTVRNHITSVFSKIGVENRSQAIVQARDAGFGRRL